MNEQITAFEQIASRIANLVHPEKIVYLPREDNWVTDQNLLPVILNQ